MANKAATPGTGFHGPLYLVDEDGNVVLTLGGDTSLSLPAAVDDTTTGTADTTDFTLADVGAAFNQGTLNNNFATIAALLDRILDRLQ